MAARGLFTPRRREPPEEDPFRGVIDLNADAAEEQLAVINEENVNGPDAPDFDSDSWGIAFPGPSAKGWLSFDPRFVWHNHRVSITIDV